MALFQNELETALRRLNRKEYETTEQRDELLAQLARAERVPARDVVWMLFRPDRALRDAAVALIRKNPEADVVDAFLRESRGKPDAAIRAAVPLLTSAMTGVESRLGQIVTAPPPPKGDTKEAAEIREIARRLIVELPPKKPMEALFWQLEKMAAQDERMLWINKLAAIEPDAAALSKWQALVRDDNNAVREKAIEILATRAPQSSGGILMEQLPHVGYATQQFIVDALSRVAAQSDGAFAEQLLPLMASGDAGTRTSVMKILLAIPDRGAVVKRYIRFTKTVAGFMRDRTLEALRAFGDALVDPVIDLLSDEDAEVRAAAVGVAAAFHDPRIVPAMIEMLRDSDWWIRVSAADTLGRLKDPRAVEPLVAALADPDAKWAAVEALGHLGDPRALPALGRMLGDPGPDVRIEVMQALKNYDHPQVVQALSRVATADPDRNVRMRALDIVEEVTRRRTDAQADVAALRSAALTARSGAGEPRLNAFLVATRNQGGSDFHLSVGQPPIVRLAAELLRADAPPLTAELTEAMIKEVMTEAQWAALHEQLHLDFCYSIPNAGRYRANVFIDSRGYNGVFRVIPDKPPTIVDIGLPSYVAEIADYHQGLIIVCGPSGSGKSTTLAALVNLFNETRNDHILTMEDPVEFVHPFKNCLVNQREVGSHTQSFARALRAALREDPDVIVIGELRDNESVSLALTAAETGHIVLGTLNSTSAPKAIDRIIGSFPSDEQPQIRAALSESMKYVIAQRLLPAKEARKQVACFEILKGTSNIGSMIRDEKTFQIYSAMQIGRNQGMRTFDDALKDLLARDLIAPETAYMVANKKEDFEAMVSPAFLAGR